MPVAAEAATAAGAMRACDDSVWHVGSGKAHMHAPVWLVLPVLTVMAVAFLPDLRRVACGSAPQVPAKNTRAFLACLRPGFALHSVRAETVHSYLFF